MKYLPLILALVLYACNQPVKDPKPITTSDTAQTKPVTTPTNNAAPKVLVGLSINGDFDGDGQLETAMAIQTKEIKENPLENKKAAVFAVQFSNNNLTTIDDIRRDIRLVNEGDLNLDGGDEISIYSNEIISTYTFKNGNWIIFMPPFKTFYYTYAGKLTDSELQNRIFIENNNVYVYQASMLPDRNAMPKKEDEILVKTKVNIDTALQKKLIHLWKN